MTKRDSNLKLKNNELKIRDQALASITQGIEDQLDKAKRDIKLVEERMGVITKAYVDLVSHAVKQFDASVDAVVQTVRSLWPDLDMARLEQALNHPAPSLLKWLRPTQCFLQLAQNYQK